MNARSRTSLWVGVAAHLVAADAYADSSGPQCAAAYEQAQVEMKSGHLGAARAQLVTCSGETCPGWMVKQCLAWSDDVERNTPTVILEVKVDGEEQTSVQVALDGAPWLTEISGRALPLELGAHTLTFAVPGLPPVQKKVFLDEWEKRVRVEVAFARPKPNAAPAPRVEYPVPAGAWTLGGIAVASVATGAAIGVWANAYRSKLETSCRPFCSDSSVHALSARYLAANIAFGVGLASAAGAVVWYALRPARLKAPAVGLVVLPTSGGARGAFEAAF